MEVSHIVTGCLLALWSVDLATVTEIDGAQIAHLDFQSLIIIIIMH